MDRRIAVSARDANRKSDEPLPAPVLSGLAGPSGQRAAARRSCQGFVWWSQPSGESHQGECGDRASVRGIRSSDVSQMKPACNQQHRRQGCNPSEDPSALMAHGDVVWFLVGH